ncbi:MAG: hypothetical protein IJ092_00720 [Atopobiaceae bacterium]|nr:hypothetical protein [Atopobiaceae bacterium]MBR1829569.1 hypothetical protein [Atopobiaceae bacterium]
MSETVVKLAGLACMIVSVFLVLFGLYIALPVTWAAPVLVAGGVALFIAGGVCYTVYHKD